MFSFYHWCAWVERQCTQSQTEWIAVTFSLGQPSPKQAAAVAFKTQRKLMQLGFWETGEADFYGLDLSKNNLEIHGFDGRVLTNESFEQTFRECLLMAASD